MTPYPLPCLPRQDRQHRQPVTLRAVTNRPGGGWRASLLCGFALVGAVAGGGSPVLAQVPGAARPAAAAPTAAPRPGGEPDYRAIAQKWAQSALAESAPAGAKLRMEVSIGAMDSRLRLAPCGNIEPYLPQGARLWGNSRVGLRCIDGVTRWNISLPANVKAFGQAWVVRGQVAQGAPITEGDVVSAEVDWAEDTSPVLMDQAAWLGQTATRQLTTGMVLRQALVKPTTVFQAGAQIRVLAQGVGFEISGDALALSAGIVGQPARVRMENGRVTTGVVLDARTVRVDI